MKKFPESADHMVLTYLPLPDGNSVEFEIPAGFSSALRRITKHILSAYSRVKTTAEKNLPPAPFNDRLAWVQDRLSKALPALPEDERFDVLYIYVMYWFSQTAGSYAPQLPAVFGPADESIESKKPVHPYFKKPESVPPRLNEYLSEVLAWILLWEMGKLQGGQPNSAPYMELRTESFFDQKKLFVPNAFINGIALVPNNPVVAAGLRAIFKGGPKARKLIGGWCQIGEEVLYRQFHRSGTGEIRYYPTLSESQTSRIINAETLWDFVEHLNPFTADIALAILAQLCEPSTGNKPKYPLRQSVLITSDAILRYKGIQKYGKDRRVMEKRIHDEIERLRTLHFDLERYPLPWSRKGLKYQGDRLFDIVKVETYQLQLFGKEKVIETAWSVRAGQWAEHFFNTEQERVWTSRMAKTLIELDYRNQRKTAQIAKKIGYLLLTVPGGTAFRNHPIVRRIDKILDEIGELPAPEHRSKDWAGRMRDVLGDAWDKLSDAGLIQDLQFPDGYGFDDADRTKGWVEDWLCSKIVITTPEAMPEPKSAHRPQMNRPDAYPSRPRLTQRVRLQPKDLQLQVCTPAYRKQLRDACQERYITQKTLAKELGIAPSTLSNILRGRDLPSMQLAKKIDRWLKRTN